MLGDDAQNCLELITSYENTHPNLKRYQGQKFTTTNPDYFNEIDSVEKAYWFGFLCADGYNNPDTYITFFQLSFKDRNRIERFTKTMGLEPTRIRDRMAYYEKDGEIIEFKSSYISFSCKPISQDLQKNGFFDFKSDARVPNFIVELIDVAKSKGEHLSDSLEGRLALSFLLGFYDGDGTYGGGSHAVIYNTRRDFLLEVKSLYGIDNRVRQVKKEVLDESTGRVVRKTIWALTLGPEIFNGMMASFINSMQRKRSS